MPYLGIDIGNATVAATYLETPTNARFLGEFENTTAGGKRLLNALPTQTDLHVIMEATGVYTETISRFFYDQHFAVYVEPPHKVKRAFQSRSKTDPVDSRQIAEYGFRFRDKLHPWQPREAVLEHLRELITIREQYTRMMTMTKNARKALERKPAAYHAALNTHRDMQATFKQSRRLLDQELHTLIKQNTSLAQHMQNLQSIKGVGFWVALNFCLITEGFTAYVDHRQLSSYLGICPFPYESGTSVKRPPRSDSAGPARMRSLCRAPRGRVD